MDGTRKVGGVSLGMPERNRTAQPWAGMPRGFARLTLLGHFLQSPQFRTLRGFRSAIKQTESASGKVRPEFIYEARKAAVVRVISDRQFAQPLADACQRRKLTPVGRLDEGREGRTFGNAILANPEYTIPLGRAHEDDVMLGVHWWNASQHGQGAGADVSGVRMVCTNYNLWGSILGSFRLAQLESPDVIFERYDRLLNAALDRSPHLRGLVETAKDTLVVADEVPEILTGIGFPPEGIALLSHSIEAWAPEAGRTGLNGWTLYNAATAYLTWGWRNSTDFDLIRDLASRASEILTTGLDRIVARGRAARLAPTEEPQMSVRA